MPGILCDESTHGNLAKAFHRRTRLGELPAVDVLRVGEPGAPPFGTLDPDLLMWCEENDRILVSDDRNTLPAHLRDHLAAGRHSPGVLLMKNNTTIPKVVESAVLIAAVDPDLCRDQCVFIPL
jgi:hypothetical protein